MQAAERRHRSQKSGDLFVHGLLLQSLPPGA
jgi:hypothetical protein